MTLPTPPLHRLAALVAVTCLGWSQMLAAASGLTLERFAEPAPGLIPDSAVEVDLIDEDWGAGAPAGLPSDGFALRWTGALVPAESDRYQLVATTSGALRVWLDEHLLLDDWTDAGNRELVSPEVALVAGARHRLVVEFADHVGDAAITLGWQRGPRDREIVPAARWTTAAGTPGIDARYVDGRDPEGDILLERVDPAIGFDWKRGAPDPAVPDDRFSVRWSGTLTPTRDRVVEFIARTDDGVRVRLDGETIVERWKDRAAGDSYSQPIALEAGTSYALEMDYYENRGRAVAELHWREAYWGRETIGREHFEQLHRPGVDPASYSPFCLELPLPPGATGRLTVAGEAVALRRATPTSVFADVPLAVHGPTRYRLEVDGEVVAGELRWSAIGLEDPAPVLLRAGDEVLVEVPPAGMLEVLEGSGLAAGARAEQVTTSGNAHRVRCSFDQAGYFTLRATFRNRRDPITRDVIVVATDLAERDFAAQIGYDRAGSVASMPESGYVHWGATDGAELEVDLLERREGEDRIGLQPHRRGEPTIIARLGGPDGPVLDLAEVQEFTLQTLGKDRLIARDEDGVDIARAQVVITPFVDDLWIELRMFAGKSTFSGGLRSASFNTSNAGVPAAGRPPLGYETVARVVDPETGETSAVLDYAVEVVDLKACHRVQVGQVNSPYEQVSDSKNNNPKVCVEYCDQPARFSIVAPDDQVLCVGDGLVLDDPLVVNVGRALICYRGQDCPDCYFDDRPAPAWEVDGLDQVDTDEPGTYTITYRLKPEDDCVECFDCEDTTTITVSDWTCAQPAKITQEPDVTENEVICGGEHTIYAQSVHHDPPRKECNGREEDDGTVEVETRWEITPAVGVAPSKGQGSTATATFTDPGEYTIQFESRLQGDGQEYCDVDEEWVKGKPGTVTVLEITSLEYSGPSCEGEVGHEEELKPEDFKVETNPAGHGGKVTVTVEKEDREFQGDVWIAKATCGDQELIEIVPIFEPIPAGEVSKTFLQKDFGKKWRALTLVLRRLKVLNLGSDNGCDIDWAVGGKVVRTKICCDGSIETVYSGSFNGQGGFGCQVTTPQARAWGFTFRVFAFVNGNIVGTLTAKEACDENDLCMSLKGEAQAGGGVGVGLIDKRLLEVQGTLSGKAEATGEICKEAGSSVDPIEFSGCVSVSVVTLSFWEAKYEWCTE